VRPIATSPSRWKVLLIAPIAITSAASIATGTPSARAVAPASSSAATSVSTAGLR
jgi:hypothetical protein